MTIVAPDEFKKLCRNLVQGLEMNSAQELVAHALNGLDAKERSIVAGFIGRMLKEPPQQKMLLEFWWSMPSDVVFYEAEAIERFLALLHVELTKPT